MLIKEQILAAIDGQAKEVPMHGTDDVMRVRQLSRIRRTASVEPVLVR
ncbi:hypothetical protein [Burkholderia gladioli]|nr:hypothetical protein [Burkholderia gladioli]MBJ9675235.1 hypothetical protein [Burkholderia gladioli]MDN7463487.1 hypothetical protein [Burkholderia gladioli]